MKALKDLAERIKSLSIDDLMRVLSQDKTFTDFIIELNTQKQLFDKGIDSTGKRLSDIGGEYSEVTLNIARDRGRSKKSESDINLNDTGDFYRSWKVFLDNNNDLQIEADSLKTSWDGTIDLLDRWGANILGLTEDSLEQLRLRAKLILIPYVKNKLLHG